MSEEQVPFKGAKIVIGPFVVLVYVMNSFLSKSTRGRFWLCGEYFPVSVTIV